jgi:uncharacterized protein (DUF58 family)
MSSSTFQGAYADPRVYCQLEQLLELAQQAKLMKLSATYRPSGILAGRNRSRLRGQGMNFEEIRGYRTGDNVRDIDWKASARSRQKMVKIFTEETDRPTVVLVDQRRSLFFGSKERTKSVTAAEVAAMIGWMVLNNGDRLGGIVFNNEEQQFLKPARTKLSATRLMQVICEYNQKLQPGNNSDEDKVTIDDVLRKTESYIGNSGTIILITDGDGLENERLDLLEYLSSRFNVLVFMIVDPLEQSITGIERLVVSDGAKQLQLGSESLARQRFEEQFESHKKSIIDRISAHGLPFGVVNTVDPVEEQLRQIFGMV